jgi:uncharacterized membrane protein
VSGRPHAGVTAATAVACAASFALYFSYAGRSFDFDEANTVGNIVRPGGLLVPFTEQEGFNNHPLFSFGLVAVSRAASVAEPWMRLLPALLGAATVGLFLWWAARRYALAPAVAGAAVLATSPLFVAQARQARGYALVVFCALAASILLVEDARTTTARVAYALAVAVAVGTHLYALLVVLAHAGYLVAGPRARRARLIELGCGVAAGSLAYVGLVGGMIDEVRARGSRAHPEFAADVTHDLLGRSMVSKILLAVLLAVCAWYLLRRREILAALAGPLVAVAWIWKVSEPVDLYPRFLLAAVLPIAAAVTWSVHRHRLLLPVALVAALAALLPQLDDLDREPNIEVAAAYVAAARELGLTPCAMGYLPIAAYTESPIRFTDAAQAAHCDVVVQVGVFGDALMAEISAVYPHHWEYADDRVVVSRVPRGALEARFD